MSKHESNVIGYFAILALLIGGILVAEHWLAEVGLAVAVSLIGAQINEEAWQQELDEIKEQRKDK